MVYTTARVDLGLSPDEFWKMQPYLFFLMQDRLISRLETDDMRMAQILCTLCNINRNPKKKSKPYKVEEFLPDRRGNRKHGKPLREAQPWQHQLEMIKVLHVAFGGDRSKIPA